MKILRGIVLLILVSIIITFYTAETGKNATLNLKDYVMISATVLIVEIPSANAVILQEYLTSKGSPYSHVDILGICEDSGVTLNECKLLIAICGEESQHGTVYRFANRKRASFDDGDAHHNCGGIKAASWHDQPWASGFSFVHFDSWDQYWNSVVPGMKKAWFDKGGNAPNILCYKYVGQQNVCESWWLNSVNSFIRDLSEIK